MLFGRGATRLAEVLVCKYGYCSASRMAKEMAGRIAGWQNSDGSGWLTPEYNSSIAIETANSTGVAPS